MKRLIVPLAAFSTLLLLGGFAFLVCDGVFANHADYTGTVLDRTYHADGTPVGYGEHVAEDGKVSPGTVTVTTDAKWSLVCRVGAETFTLDAKPEQWVKAQIGDRVKVRCALGKFTHWRWSQELAL